MQFTIAKDELERLGLVCGAVKSSLDLVTKDIETTEMIYRLATAVDQTVSAVATDSEILRGRIQIFEAELLTARVSLNKLEIIKKQLVNHRDMLAKIARMKVSAGGRNMEAAMAAESFLVQNSAVI